MTRNRHAAQILAAKATQRGCPTYRQDQINALVRLVGGRDNLGAETAGYAIIPLPKR
jgi:hypothetical protein